MEVRKEMNDELECIRFLCHTYSWYVGLALDLEDYHPSVLLHCWFGHLTCKIVSEMTYNVSSGTLNPTIPYHTYSWYISYCSQIVGLVQMIHTFS